MIVKMILGDAGMPRCLDGAAAISLIYPKKKRDRHNGRPPTRSSLS